MAFNDESGAAVQEGIFTMPNNDDRWCFVLMPFTVKDQDLVRYADPDHWTEVYCGLIEPSVKKAGLRPERDDQDRKSRLIVEGILTKIEEADIILCDLSSHNPNVFLELGWALRADKPYVLTKDDLTTYTFDLGQQYIVDYSHHLRPRALDSEIDRLAEAITVTLDDTQRDYSLMKRMSLSVAALEALKTGEVDTRLLADTRQMVQQLLRDWGEPRSTAQEFPWPTLLGKATHILSNVRELLSSAEVETVSDILVQSMNSLAENLDARHAADVQVSIIDQQRKFLYHDRAHMIGRQASKSGFEGSDIYDGIWLTGPRSYSLD